MGFIILRLAEAAKHPPAFPRNTKQPFWMGNLVFKLSYFLNAEKTMHSYAPLTDSKQTKPQQNHPTARTPTKDSFVDPSAFGKMNILQVPIHNHTLKISIWGERYRKHKPYSAVYNAHPHFRPKLPGKSFILIF